MTPLQSGTIETVLVSESFLLDKRTLKWESAIFEIERLAEDLALYDFNSGVALTLNLPHRPIMLFS